MWQYFSCYFVPDVYATCIPSDTLSTQPRLQSSILASGYANFTVQACFDSASYLSCFWKHGSVEGSFYSQPNGGCNELLEGDSYMIECFIESVIIETSLTLLTPVPMGSNLFQMICFDSLGAVSFSLNTTAYVQSEHV